jgi:hypothetical protein
LKVVVRKVVVVEENDLDGDEVVVLRRPDEGRAKTTKPRRCM